MKIFFIAITLLCLSASGQDIQLNNYATNMVLLTDGSGYSITVPAGGSVHVYPQDAVGQRICDGALNPGDSVLFEAGAYYNVSLYGNASGQFYLPSLTYGVWATAPPSDVASPYVTFICGGILAYLLAKSLYK